MMNVSRELSLAEKVGGYLKKELTRRGLTYWDFSGIVGYSDKQVGRWCRDGVYSVKAIEDIVCALGVSYSDVVGDNVADDVPFLYPFSVDKECRKVYNKDTKITVQFPQLNKLLVL